MGILQRLLGVSPRQPKVTVTVEISEVHRPEYVDLGESRGELPAEAWLLRDGRGVTVVGESYRQDAITRLIGGGHGGPVRATFWATLNAEDELAMSLDGKSRAEIAASKPAMKDGRESGPGTYRGRHHSEWHTEVHRLRTMGDEAPAEQLLLGIVEATEAEAAQNGLGVAPGAYEQLAIIYSKRKDRPTEIAILERFAGQQHAPGVTPAKLLARLEKAKAKQQA